ncbi:TPA: ead/Ea22-like family protein [Klebsiella pneumoniae]|nr:ead/Ea22-like family protein [Klebsiella pneumoniae]
MTTNITELAQSLKAAAEKATQGNWRAFQYHDGRCGIGGGHNNEIMVCEHISKERQHDAMFIALANPANILALVEVLENSESRLHEVAVACATAEQALEKSQQQMTESENRVRKQNRHICELFDDNTALRQRIAGLEARTVKLPDELSGETLLDVASRTDLVYSDDTGVLEYTNVNGCFVKVTAPPDKVIRFRCSNKRIYMRLVDRVKTHEHAGIIIDFPKKL